MAGKTITKSQSLDALRGKVRDALQTKYGSNNPNGPYVYVRDLFADKVVYEVGSSSTMYACSYSVLDGAVTLGDPMEVEASYTPVGESHRELLPESVALAEAALDEAASTITLTVIKPGMSLNNRYYPASVLKRDHKIFEGAKMFVDHQTESEAKSRPEGSVRNWAATLKKVWCESDGTVKGQATVIDPALKSKLSELKKANQLADMGISIRAVGEASQSEGKGSKYLYVERLVKARSVDFVTFPGAGGQVETMESAGSENDVDLLSEAQLRERRPDLVSVIETQVKEQYRTMKTVEELTAELAESNRKLEEANTKTAASEKQARIATASVAIAKAINESKLPQPAKDKLTKQFEGAESADGVAAAITEMEQLIAAVTGGKTKKVRNMGESHSEEVEEGAGTEEDVTEEDLAESFKGIGLTDEQAKIAARGRK